MFSPEIQLYLTVDEADADSERLAELTTRLQRDLHDLGAESVERPHKETPLQGAKGEPFTIGALVLVVVPVLLPKLVEFLQGWSLRGENRKVRIKTPAGLEIEFTPEKKFSEAELLALVEKLSETQ